MILAQTLISSRPSPSPRDQSSSGKPAGKTYNALAVTRQAVLPVSLALFLLLQLRLLHLFDLVRSTLGIYSSISDVFAVPLCMHMGVDWRAWAGLRSLVSLPAARTIEPWKAARCVRPYEASGVRRAARARKADMSRVMRWGGWLRLGLGLAKGSAMEGLSEYALVDAKNVSLVISGAQLTFLQRGEDDDDSCCGGFKAGSYLGTHGSQNFPRLRLTSPAPQLTITYSASSSAVQPNNHGEFQSTSCS